MNIDLFINPNGESGLLCDGGLESLPAGVLFDAETRALTIEFMDPAIDPFHLNITIEEEYRDLLLFSKTTYIGILSDGLVADTLELPLHFLNDPYGSPFVANDGRSPRRSFIGFEEFMKRCTVVQPVHRDDLGDENNVGTVLRGMDPKALEYVPQMIKQRMLELRGPQLAPQMDLGHAPAPQMEGPKGPGGMAGHAPQRRIQRPIKRRDDGE